jgi:hypothetical protein
MPTQSIETKKKVALAAINRAKQALEAIPEGMDGRDSIVAKIRVAEASLEELCKKKNRSEEMGQMTDWRIAPTGGATLKEKRLVTALDKNEPTASVEPPTAITPSVPGSRLAAKRKEWLAKKASDALKSEESPFDEEHAQSMTEQSGISPFEGAIAAQMVSEEKKPDDVPPMAEEGPASSTSNSNIITAVLSIEEQEQIEVTYHLIEERLSWLETEQEKMAATDAPPPPRKQSAEERMAWLQDMKRKAREASTLEEQTEIANMLIAAGTDWL